MGIALKMKYRNSLKLYLILLFSILAFSVYGQNCVNVDGKLQPGEYCDGSELFDDVGSCSDIYGDGWEGTLSCKNNCQLDISQCDLEDDDDAPPGGEECGSCNECDDIDGFDCSYELCILGCDDQCNYLGENEIGEDCESCDDVLRCEDYENPLSCRDDTCQTVDNGDGFACEWVNNRCVPNTDCQWDCSQVYDVCTNGFKEKTGRLCDLIDGDPTECNANNPAYQFPDRLACGIDTRAFPVFTWLNFSVSILLIAGYYLLRKKF